MEHTIDVVAVPASWPAKLVGREQCTGTVLDAIGQVTAGGFAVLEVSGEPGVGKTRLLHEIHRLASRSALLVCSGQATRFEQDTPFAVVTEALRPADRAGRTFGELTARRDAHAAVRRLLEEHAGTGSALLIDDAHWADDASLELVEQLIRKPPSAPVLIAVTFRNASAPAALVDAVTHRAANSFRLKLEPLSGADVERLLPDLSGHRRELLLRASGGVPLYLTALAGLDDDALAAVAGAVTGTYDEPAAVLPTDGWTRQVLVSLAVDVVGLDQPVQLVAMAAALIGEHATIDLVGHAAQLPPSAVVDAMDELCRTGLCDLDGAWIRFRHPLVRSAVHAMTGPAWRVRAHARAAEFLRAQHAPTHVLAHHIERSAQYGDVAAATVLVEAGTTALYRTPDAAARWLGCALRILHRPGRARPTILLRYAQALGLTGELARSRELLQELLCEHGPIGAAAAAFGAVVARLRGDLNEAAALLDTAALHDTVQRHAEHRPCIEGKLRLERAVLALLREDAAAAVEHAEHALPLLAGDRPELAAAAQALRAAGASYAGEPVAARGLVAAAARLTDAASDVALRPRVELLALLAWVELRLGEVTAATRHLARAGAIVGLTGRSAATPYLLVVDAAVQSRLGRLDAAIRLADRAAEVADTMGSTELLAMADVVRLQPLLWTAGPAATLPMAERLGTADQTQARLCWRAGRISLALVHAIGGEPATCLRLVADRDTRWPADPPTQVARQVASALALARTGDLTAASTAGEAAEAIATSAGLDYELGLARYASADVAARARRLDQAIALAEESVALFAAAGAAVEQARAHQLAGAAHALADRPERSREEFGLAKAGSLRCGATWLLAAVRRDQTRYAALMPRQGRQAVDGSECMLTSRERQIADLAVAGLTNQDIATRLVLSRRTVETHLSRVFAKLDVRSRTALACRLGNGGNGSVGCDEVDIR